MVLHADETGPAVPLGDVLRLGELPRVHRTRPDVAGLARLHHVVQGLHGLLDRRRPVPAVDLVEVDVVGAQTAQAVVDLGHDRLAGQPATVGPRPHLAVHLGGQHDLVAAGEVGQRPADDLLAGAVGIDVRGVEEVDPCLDGLPYEGPAGLLVQRPAVGTAIGGAVAHTTQADAGDVETGRAEFQIVHGHPPYVDVRSPSPEARHRSSTAGQGPYPETGLRSPPPCAARSSPGLVFVTRFALPYCSAASLCAGQVRGPVVAEVHGGREVGKSVAARR